MKRWLLILTVFALVGCASSPIKITHEYGSLPKCYIDMPEDYGELKVRGKRGEVKFIWKKKF